MKFVKEGDDKLGYRIRTEAQVGGDGPDVNFYVVREGGDYRLAGISLAPSTMGREPSSVNPPNVSPTTHRRRAAGWSAVSEERPRSTRPSDVDV